MKKTFLLMFHLFAYAMLGIGYAELFNYLFGFPLNMVNITVAVVISLVSAIYCFINYRTD